MEIPKSKHHMLVEDLITSIFWLEGEEMIEAEIPGEIEGDDEEISWVRRY